MSHAFFTHANEYLAKLLINLATLINTLSKPDEEEKIT